MIDRLARNPKQCLNLKNEWSLSRKPALESRGKNKEPAGIGKIENPEQSKLKRGRQKEEVTRDTGQEGRQRPGKRMNRREAPEREITLEATSGGSGAPTSTGASTPVAVKVRRIEKESKVGQGPSSNQIQPTLRSFMDLKGGLVGVRNRPGDQKPGKLTRAGRDPSVVSQGDSSLLLGEAAGGKESRSGGSHEDKGSDRSKDGWFEIQEQQGVTISSTRPGQGKVVASRREAYEGKDVCGGTRKGGGSKR